MLNICRATPVYNLSLSTWKKISSWRCFSCCSVAKLCPTLCDPMGCSMPGFLVFHYLLDCVHWVSDAILPSHPLPPPFSSYPQSLHQDLFQWVNSASGGQNTSASASVLPVNIQGWFPLGLTGLIFMLSKGLSSFSSRTTIWEHQFFSTQPSLWSNPHICTWLLEKPQLWLDRSLTVRAVKMGTPGPSPVQDLCTFKCIFA